MKSEQELASDWYQPEDIHRSLVMQAHSIPADHESLEFAVWLTDQYRRAMMKGMQLSPRAARYQDSANASAHVIVENGVIPGVTSSCRCEECRGVAATMAEAGYLDRVDDKWWESECDGTSEQTTETGNEG